MIYYWLIESAINLLIVLLGAARVNDVVTSYKKIVNTE